LNRQVDRFLRGQGAGKKKKIKRRIVKLYECESREHEPAHQENVPSFTEHLEGGVGVGKDRFITSFREEPKRGIGWEKASKSWGMK